MGLAGIRKYDFRLKRNSILRDFGFIETPEKQMSRGDEHEY